VSLLQPATSADVLPVFAERSITALSLERVPRITRAQSMDVLSSQSTVAGYKAVLIGASLMPKFLPMLTTAAGNIAPAKAFILGAGVAGLQAIATARRLGAIVSAFDVRPAVREQVQSLGASFVAAEAISADAEDKSGYAREQSEAQQQRTAALLHDHLKQMDLIIATAQIPGRPAPKLMVADMRPGSVIGDLAAESGGNCTLTRAGETVNANGVLVYGAVDIPSTVPTHASQMLGRNILTLLQHLMKDGAVVIDVNDEITGPMCVVYQGQLRA
jgi:NAD(P) transhydrogenase subunit alpha